jgi:hypothetical protein
MGQRRAVPLFTSNRVFRVQGAIAKRADEIYEALPPAQQEAARRALVRLVRPGEGTEDTRRRAALDDLGADARLVIERLASAWLLTLSPDQARQVQA